MRKGSITLTIDSRLGEVFLVSSAVRGICRETSLSEMETYQVETCVVEAVNNAILHAYQNKEGHQVSVDVTVDDDRLTVTVCDSGRTMQCEPRDLPDFDHCDVRQLPENGWGWGIMRAWMDGVGYAAAGGQNVLRLVKRLAPVPAGGGGSCRGVT
jgi:serine/threonine-protein kinase RsbW